MADYIGPVRSTQVFTPSRESPTIGPAPSRARSYPTITEAMMRAAIKRDLAAALTDPEELAKAQELAMNFSTPLMMGSNKVERMILSDLLSRADLRRLRPYRDLIQFKGTLDEATTRLASNPLPLGMPVPPGMDDLLPKRGTVPGEPVLSPEYDPFLKKAQQDLSMGRRGMRIANDGDPALRDIRHNLDTEWVMAQMKNPRNDTFLDRRISQVPGMERTAALTVPLPVAEHMLGAKFSKPPILVNPKANLLSKQAAKHFMGLPDDPRLPWPEEGSLLRPIIAHEGGERAVMMGEEPLNPLSSHAGIAPKMRELEAASRDPMAYAVSEATTTYSPSALERLFMRKYREFGGTNGVPLPLTGRRADALNDIITEGKARGLANEEEIKRMEALTNIPGAVYMPMQPRFRPPGYADPFPYSPPTPVTNPTPLPPRIVGPLPPPPTRMDALLTPARRKALDKYIEKVNASKKGK